MLETLKAFFSSVGIHILILGSVLLTFNFDSGKAITPPASSSLPEPVIAEALDAAQVEREIANLQAAENKKRQDEADRQAKLKAEADAAQKKRQAEEKRLAELEKKRKADAAAAEKKRQLEKQRLADLEAKRKVEEQRQAELKKQRQAEEKRLQELAAAKQKEAAEKARLEAERIKLEKQRAAEAAARKAKAEAERKAKAAAAKKAAAEAARQKALEDELAAALAAEANSGAMARDREIYRGLIAQAVQRQWVRPESAKVAECVVRVTQIPGGEVVRVAPQPARCGGDSLFQRSVVKAVEDASPLPSPPNPDVFEREIEFLFNPQ